MNNLLKKRKKKHNKNSKILSNRAYNALFGATVLYGLILNYLLCAYGAGFVMSLNPIKFLLFSLFLEIIGIIISLRSKNPIFSFIGYNFLVISFGLLLSIILHEYGGVDSIIVKQTFLYTSIITGIMVILGVLYPKLFEKIRYILFINLSGIAITHIIILISNMDNTVISWITAIVYSLYIGYDIYISQAVKKTVDNAIDCSINIYLDIVGLLLEILKIIAEANDRKNK